MSLAIIFVTLLLLISIKNKSLIPSRLQSISEIFYEFISNMVSDNIGDKGRKFFPLIFTLFTFLLFGNMLGMLPYSFTFTSHIIVTFVLAMFIFLLVTLLGIFIHGFKFFGLFVPKGVPMLMLPLMIPIEIISYLSRPISLSVRLFANMMAGHTMLKIFAGFIVPLGIFGIAPLMVDVALTALEVLIAFLQAYVFTILTCLYLNEAINLH
jgi:F-type H+-transporting ATPase subunit a